MKKASFLFVFQLVIFQLFSQTDLPFGLYRWNTNAPMQECDRSGTVATPPVKVDAEAGQIFKLLDFIDNDAIIQILDYTKKDNSGNLTVSNATKFEMYNVKSLNAYSTLPPDAKNNRVYNTLQKYFRINKNYIANSASKFLGRNVDLSVGVLALPLKMRLKDGDFSGSFTIGGTGGIKLRASRYKDNKYHNILIGLGLSNISIDSNTVSRGKNDIVSNLSGLSTSFGYLFQSGKAQAGIFMGFDFISHSNESRYGWRYQGKPWISLAFGISVFGDGKDDTKDSDKKQQEKQ